MANKKIPLWLRQERAARREIEIERGITPLRSSVHKGKRDYQSRKKNPNTIRRWDNES